jgi:WD40 repeat protein
MLAKRFADLVRDAVEARGGRVIELRGDEALAVFESPEQAVRAALEFQATCAEESEADPAFPLPVGIGIDTGEAVPVEDGYRGVALNMAARLCSNAAAGQVLVTRTIVNASEPRHREISFVERGPASFKGFEQAVDVIEAIAADESRHPSEREPRLAERDRGIPPELDPLTPLVDREHEMRWLRGTWRQVRRGRGRALFVSGPAQIGKTRLASEIAAHVHADGAVIRYAGPGGAATAVALSAIRTTRGATTPTLLVLDDVDVSGPQVAHELMASFEELTRRPVLVLGLLRDRTSAVDLAAAIERADGRGDGHRVLVPLDIDGVRGIVRLYVGETEVDAPVESMARASQGIPGRVHEVVAEWARSETSRRFAAAAEFLAAGRDRHAADLEFANNVIGLKLGRLYSVEGRDVLSVETCPYKGLAAFEEDDSAYFFGRERLVGELAARTVQVGLLGVVGASGSGKSSVIAAGLLPSLQAGLLPGSEQWRRAYMRPGEHPMEELRNALSNEAPDPLAVAVADVPVDGRLVLVVDQFEETFTICASEEECAGFIDALTDAATAWPERVVVILAIRGDYYGHCAMKPQLARALAANHVLMGPLSRDELRRAIELPARRTGLRVESALTDPLVEEVADEPGGLPLLSTALVELWHAREDGWIRMEAYKRTGGVRGAVSRLAESSYGQLSEREQEAARRVFLRLVATGEGDAPTRRRVSLEEFDLDRDSAAAGVLARLTQDRLLTIGEGAVEVAHEALLREWPRARAWLDEDAQGRNLRQLLTQASRQWQSGGQEPSELYRGARLSGALDWSAEHAAELNELEREFLGESRQASEREADRQRRTNRRLRGLLVGVAVFLIVALVAGVLALVQQGSARRSARAAERDSRIATARELAAAAVASLDHDSERSVLLAMQAVKTTRTADGTVLPEAEEALHRAVQADRLLLTIHTGTSAVVRFNPDGTRLISPGLEPGTAQIFDASTGALVRTLHGQGSDPLSHVNWSPDGRFIATASRTDASTEIWDAESGSKLHRLTVRSGDPVCCWEEFSPDGSVLTTDVWDGTERIWDTSTGKQLAVLDGGGPKAFSPDGKDLWLGTCVGDWSTPKKWPRLCVDLGPDTGVTDLSWSSTGDRVATSTTNGTVILWNARTGHQEMTVVPGRGEIRDIELSPGGDQLATGFGDGTADVWNLTHSGAELALVLAGHEAGIQSMKFTPDGARLATASEDGTVKVWDVTLRAGGERGTQPGSGALAASPTGNMLAIGRADGSVAIEDAHTGAVRRTIPGEGKPVVRLAFGAKTSTLAAAWDDGTLEVLDPRSGDELAKLRSPTPIDAMALDPRGSKVAAISGDIARIWDVATGQPMHTLHGVHDTLAFSPDGRLLAVTFAPNLTGNEAIQVWNTSTWSRIRTVTWPGRVWAYTVTFGPDGSRLYTAGLDGNVRAIGTKTWRPILRMSANLGRIWAIATSSDGKMLATASEGGLQLWDVAARRVLFGLSERSLGRGSAIGFSADGSRLLAPVAAHAVGLYLLRIDDLMSLARSKVTRGFSDQECRQYLHRDACPSGSA